ncbi:putative metalloprotease CJM1_0395 family protein [Halovibrio sp. HP20-50]|uniref:putative metalloprotease CJM1_0395 family protein n=1 Tax=Halovibrio sp. HP20-59 TaxID=3080275 RepID=UPI00294AD012|nr:putative metalloprotease CJM1_0395 family protein [Halovibrio sp. HP20-59]MEA2119776.1 putative metalloprotease CJM1_0395 family protein [Halovibrio sp. HP20-59]
MAVSSISSSVSLTAWASPAVNTMSPRVEQAAKSRAPEEDTTTSDDPNATSTSEQSSDAAGPKRADGTPMAPEEIQLLDQLKQTDREVRQHEMAHQTVGGAYTGGASYEYEVGPDGKRYAVAGEVPIDYGPVPNDPQATIEKMQTVIAAAMAPADPSPTDYQVAAQARQYLLEAKLDASMQRSEMEQARNAGAVSSSATAPSTGEPPTDEQAA